jgi:hypothetical protein
MREVGGRRTEWNFSTGSHHSLYMGPYARFWQHPTCPVAPRPGLHEGLGDGAVARRVRSSSNRRVEPLAAAKPGASSVAAAVMASSPMPFRMTNIGLPVGATGSFARMAETRGKTPRMCDLVSPPCL